MAVELTGTVLMDGDHGPGIRVRVRFEDDRLRITAGADVLGEWATGDMGIHPLNEGFSIRAESEEFLLHTEDDAALADEMDLKTASPRLARQIAARHLTEQPEPSPSPLPSPTRVGPIAFALFGAMIVVGATLLRDPGTGLPTARGGGGVIGVLGVPSWLAFMIVGISVVAVAYALAIGARWARGAAVALVVVAVALFGWVVGETSADAGHLTAFGFLGGGLAVGVAVVFSGNLESRP